jgi:hypothetical protein
LMKNIFAAIPVVNPLAMTRACIPL